MKGYRQYCAVARGLDLIGERWTLLIVRELLALGPIRFSDIEDGIPGCSRLLSVRLRAMEQAGIVERPESGRGARYVLTDWGGGWNRCWQRSGLGRPDAGRAARRRPVPGALAGGTRPRHLRDRQPDAPPVRLALESVPVPDGREDTERLVVAIGGRIEVLVDDRGPADAMLRGDAGSLVRTLAGVRSPGQPGAATLTGDVAVFERVSPRSAGPADLGIVDNSEGWWRPMSLRSCASVALGVSRG